MSLSETTALLALLSVTGFVAYWVLWSYRDAVPMSGSVAKAAATAALAVIAVMQPGLWLIALGLALGAVGDFALSRRGEAAFLAGMAAFALGHLAYAAAFLGQVLPLAEVAVGHWIALGLLLALIISTEFWLAPRTGGLRWPVRGYVAVIGLMAALVILQAPHSGRVLLWLGAGFFVASDLMLALRLFVVTDAVRQRALSLTLWPAYWLGQVLILAGAYAYWVPAAG